MGLTAIFPGQFRKNYRDLHLRNHTADVAKVKRDALKPGVLWDASWGQEHFLVQGTTYMLKWPLGLTWEELTEI